MGVVLPEVRPVERVACPRPTCPCPHDECDAGWVESCLRDGAVAPCPGCRPEMVAATPRESADRAAWMAGVRARRSAR